MPWRCPACRSEIAHDVLDRLPRSSMRYRCHVCRLDLRFNETSTLLEVTPLDPDHAVLIPDDRPRTIPPTLPTGHRKTLR